MGALYVQRHTALGQTPYHKDLAFAKSHHLDQISLSHLAEKILRLHPLGLGRITGLRKNRRNLFLTQQFPLTGCHTFRQ